MNNYLTRVAAVGIQSGDFKHTLDRVNVITGNSFSGKTARLNAIRLALVNHCPELGKTNDSTFQLARNGLLVTEVEDSRGKVRGVTVSKVKNSIKCVPNGDLEETPTVLLDPTEYFGLSDAKKIQYVFGMFRMDDNPAFSGESIIAAIKNLTLERNDEHTVARVRELAAELDESDTERHQQGQSIQEWLGDRITYLKDQLKIAKQTCERMTKTVQGITQLTANDAPAPNYENELKAKREQMSALTKSFGSLEQLNTGYDNAKKAVDDLTARLDKTQAVSVPDVTSEVEAIEAMIAALSKPDAEDERLAAEIRQLDEQSTALRTEIDAYKSLTNTLVKEQIAAQAPVDSAKYDIQFCDRQIATLNSELEAKLARPCCPECGVPTETAKDAIEKAHATAVEALKKKKADAEATLAKEQKRVDKAAKRVEESRKDDAAIDEKRNAYSKILQQSNTLGDARHKAARARTSDIESKRQQIKSLEQSVTKAKEQNTSIDALAVDRKAARQRLAEFDKADIDRRLEQAKAEQAALNQAIAELETRQREYTRAKDDERRNAQALLEHKKSEVAVEVLKAGVQTLEEIQSSMVAAAFGKILKTVNSVTSGIIPEPIEYRDGELGRWKGATWVKHETFSGTEKALTYIGLSLALSENAPIKIVLLDEMGIMDPQTLKAFLTRVIDLVKQGVIDQFVGAYSGKVEPMEGVNFISLSVN